jgi:hypothetical protein
MATPVSGVQTCKHIELTEHLLAAAIWNYSRALHGDCGPLKSWTELPDSDRPIYVMAARAVGQRKDAA